ncbi:MAG: VPDSG-CTERM sorting domain-containing protein [Opitutaceae bacterium]|nr:VPDSG-CTERM sorting domain-containing protein [Opitutaceae bacterium]
MITNLRKYLTNLSLAAAVAFLFAPSAASAITITGANRSFEINPATTGTSGASLNPGAGDVGAFFGGTWTSAGERTSAGTDNFFTVNLLAGSFGSGDASGTWSIAPSFWSTYGSAVISVHVGQGQGDPDYWMFGIPANTLSGTWAYDIFSGGGGGLSNIKLWGSGTPRPPVTQGVPDGGFTLALLGLGLGLVVIARRKLC